MLTETALMKRLKLSHPIIQAPMAGGGDTPDLVAAVSNAGGLGCIGATYLTPRQIEQICAAVHARTDAPFGINLFAPQDPPEPPENPGQAVERVAPYFAELGLPPPAVPEPTSESFDEKFAAALDSGAAAFSFTLGLLPADAIRALRSSGMFVAGTATSVEEAIALQESGVDAVIAQGSEAGGHRATFTGDVTASMVGTMALVPQIVDAVNLPVIASGGIMDGRGIAAALALGAGAVQMGTAFLTTEEAGIPECYKQAILKARENQTRLTRAFSGRPARGIINRFMSELDTPGTADAILPFPLQNVLTRPLRTAAAKEGRPEFLSLWAGQGVRLARSEPAAALVARLATETQAAITQLTGSNQPT